MNIRLYEAILYVFELKGDTILRPGISQQVFQFPRASKFITCFSRLRIKHYLLLTTAHLVQIERLDDRFGQLAKSRCRSRMVLLYSLYVGKKI
jgi:hypothetical protein